MGLRDDTPTTTAARRRARELGVDLDVTQEQLNRWRDRHLIPTPDPVGRGPRKGVGQLYEEPKLDYIIEFAQQPRHNLNLIPAAMFLDGYDVPEECLRASYRRLLDDLDAGVARQSSDGGDVHDASEEFAHRARRQRGPDAAQGRQFRRKIYKQRRTDPFFPEDNNDPMDPVGFDLWALMNIFLAGAAPDQLTDDGLRDLAALANPAIAAVTSGNQLTTDEQRDQFHAIITSLATGLRDLAETAPYGRLKWAAQQLSTSSVDPYQQPEIALMPLILMPLADALTSAIGDLPDLDPPDANQVGFEGENPS